jgi:hypothetical protein
MLRDKVYVCSFLNALNFVLLKFFILNSLFKLNSLSTALNILRLHEDEFNLIHMNGNSLVVYANYGQLYSTKCVSIHEIFIPPIVDTCTFDLPVYYVSNDNIQITLFLTNIGILRNGSTIIRCSQEPSVFNIGNKIITVHN